MASEHPHALVLVDDWYDDCDAADAARWAHEDRLTDFTPATATGGPQLSFVPAPPGFSPPLARGAVAVIPPRRLGRTTTPCAA